MKTKVRKKTKTDSSRRWLLRQLNDPYVALAKKKGYRSRAVFKLIEIDDKYRLIRPSMTVVDLGAAPGGWSQVVCERLKNKGLCIALDINEMDPIPGVEIIQGNFFKEDTLEKLQSLLTQKIDLVLSDMAAPACGISQVDHLRIINLLEIAFDFAKNHLKQGGSFVGKVLKGGTERSLLTQLQQYFTKVSHYKPPASRQESSETYVIAQEYKASLLSHS